MIEPSRTAPLRLPPTPSLPPWLRWPLAVSLAVFLTLLPLAAMFPGPRTTRPPHVALKTALLPQTAQETRAKEKLEPKKNGQKAPKQAPAGTQKSEINQTTSHLVSAEESPDPDKPHNPQAFAEARTTQEKNGSISAEQTSAPAHRAGEKTINPPLAQRCPEQVKPGFPERAREDEVSEGRVSARLYLSAEGRVLEVEILSAEPPGYFEKEVRRAALKWRCQGSGQAESIKVPFRFEMPSR